MARTFIKGFVGAMTNGSSAKYGKLSKSSDDEFRANNPSTTNSELSMELPASPESPEETGLIFDTGKTTVFSQHYFLELCEESLLGTGSSAVVRICNEIHTGERLACKIILKSHLTTEQRQRVYNETKIHHFLSSHPHVVRLEDVCEDEDYVYLIMENCKGGDLSRMIWIDNTWIDSGLPEAKAAEIITCLAEFLSFSHEKGIVHRDLKPENILLDEKYPENDSASIKVVDFGHAFHQSLISDNPATSPSGNLLGTHGYIAPEILRGERYGTGIDVWSAGVVLCNLLTGQMPFGREHYQDLIEHRATLDFQRNDKWNAVPAEAQHLIAGMLSLDPASRISAVEICAHPWIKKHAKKREAKARRAALRKKLGKFSGGSKSNSSVLACFGGSPKPHHSWT